MAIIIPSKHIYSKSFDPVVDNNIDKVEASATSVKTPKEYNSIVYSGDILPNSTKSELNKSDNASTGGQNYNPAVYNEADNFVFARLEHVTATIKLQKKQYNKYITRIAQKLAQLNESGHYEDNDINYTLYYKIKEYDVSASLSVPIINPYGNYYRPAPEQATPSNVVFYNEQLSSETQSGHISTQEDRETQKIIISHDASFTSNKGDNTYVESIATVTFEKNEISDAVSITENEEEYSIMLKILSSKDWYYLEYKYNEYGYYDDTNGIPNPRPLTGHGIALVPQSIQLSVYGDYFSINLETNAVLIGDGNNVFSFDGNELIQTTNTPSTKSKYQSVIDEWKNGKQTAVITCPIADYYDENGIKKISINKNWTYYTPITISVIDTDNFHANSVKVRSNTILTVQQIKENPYIYYDGAIGQIVAVEQAGFLIVQSDSSKFFMLIGRGEVTAYRNRSISSMLFREGDIVIPYIYTNQGDKPLSYNKDFTPKQFKVVGARISKRQGGMQELTLQEV